MNISGCSRHHGRLPHVHEEAQVRDGWRVNINRRRVQGPRQALRQEHHPQQEHNAGEQEQDRPADVQGAEEEGEEEQEAAGQAQRAGHRVQLGGGESGQPEERGLCSAGRQEEQGGRGFGGGKRIDFWGHFA